MAVYSALLFYWMFVGFGRSVVHNGGYHYNVIPFHTIKLYFNHADHFRLHVWLVNIIGNIAVFVPFGAAAVMLPRVTLSRFLSVFVPAIAIVELMQLVLKRGSFDVDDIILNTFGALIGYILFRHIGKMKFANE
ncbi:hypothetical protein VN24_01760 [Paenibacillus beijingensis]|uniref:VanZ-like domain-containing protein n=2 Tax=Paenibacillus beijingensis TaxID=1126833 RepID=A0A0D5NQH0_9BACL|nr:hypothetical protein VN24_01760 [Paenibacillus beijingensis]